MNTRHPHHPFAPDPKVPHFFVAPPPDVARERGAGKCWRCGHTTRHRVHLRRPGSDSAGRTASRAAAS